MDSKKEKCGENSKKRHRLSLSRFASPLTANEMTKVCEGFTPQNTTKNTDRALRVFQEWQKQRDGDQCPSDLLECPSAEKLNYWLSRFVIECRRVDGQPYPSSTLYQLLAGLLRSPKTVQIFWTRKIQDFKT